MLCRLRHAIAGLLLGATLSPAALAPDVAVAEMPSAATMDASSCNLLGGCHDVADDASDMKTSLLQSGLRRPLASDGEMATMARRLQELELENADLRRSLGLDTSTGLVDEVVLEVGEAPRPDGPGSSPRTATGAQLSWERIHRKQQSTDLASDPLYSPNDPALLAPSSAPTLTFYVYRVQSADDFPMSNVVVGSAGGALWYLHNEMVQDCRYDGVPGARRWNSTRILRAKMSMKAPQPLADRGMNFGHYCSFNSGECTGPHQHGYDGLGTGENSKPEWENFGFHVGCTVLGDYPYEAYESGKRYPNPVWYSLPGPCPTRRFAEQTAQCAAEVPGGLCDKVTGQGNCTFSVEEAGEVDIDELVGIKPLWPDRASFCRAGCVEGEGQQAANQVPFGPKDNLGALVRKKCITWWHNIWNPIENAYRVSRLLAMFHKKYPNMPTEEELPPPTCDFHRGDYSTASRKLFGNEIR